MKIKLKVNKKIFSVDVDPDTPLIFVLRNYLKLKGTKLGCSLEQCGACLVISDNNILYSCTTPVQEVEGKNLTTIEGLSDPETIDPIQSAFIKERAAQCGYCLPGIIISTKVLLNQNSKPTKAEIKEALSPNLCRCGSHHSIIRAVLNLSQGIDK